MTDARLLGGRYEIGHVLGYGGMAEVHMGRDHRLGRDVAIKVLRSDLARDPGFQARFRREAQNAAALNHPAIVSVYDTGEDDNGRDPYPVPFIVMEYVEGHTLKEVLTAETRLMPQRAMEITADICAALDFSHRHGIIHRDIKPGNVMLTPQGAVKVMDFGIARAITSASSQMTATSAVIGTAQYLSPEQARGETVDARSDVYSTGCLLYELLVGEPPFTGDNPVSVAYQHVREDPVPPSERNPEISSIIDSIVLKAMAKNPINRYQSAGEMRADLLRAAAGRPVAATPVMPSSERTAVLGGGAATRVVPGAGGYHTAGAQGGAPDKRRGTVIAVAVLAVLALVAVIGFAASQLLGGGGNKVVVANVLGQNQVSATKELQNQGFKVTAKKVTSTAAEKDKVKEQNPDAGSSAEKGSTVELGIGAGPTTVAVPDVTQGDQDGAEAQLKQAGLKMVVKNDEDSSEPAGNVTRTDPPAGRQVPVSSTVTVYVSKASKLLVPQIVGLQLADAIAALRDANLGYSYKNVPSDQPKGQVVTQSLPQNSQVTKGTKISFTVSNGQGSTPTSAPPTDGATPTDGPSDGPTTGVSPTESLDTTATPTDAPLKGVTG